MDTEPEAVLVTRESADAVADAVSRGFHDNEMWCWIIPDPRRRGRLLQQFYRATVRHVFAPREHAWTTPDSAGGALWFAPGEESITPMQAIRELRVLAPALKARGLRRALAIESVKKRHRPAEPHWYLETLSVTPEKQRSGVGTALIAPVLDQCDREGIPAYLETQRQANIPYYERFGFSLKPEMTALDSPPLWPMLRQPQGRA